MKHFFSTILAVLMAVTGFNANAWVVSGAGAILNGETWNHNSTKNTMVQQNDGTYRLEVTDCTLEVGTTYEWLVTDGSNWIKTGGNGKGSNFTITVNETAKYTVVYNFDGNETASATVTKTGAAGEVTHAYSIAGTPASIFGAEWDPTNTSTDMTVSATSGDVYEWTSAEFSPNASLAIEFKVVVDHAWGEAYGNGGNNYQITAPAGGPYRLHVTFNKTSKAVSAELLSETEIEHVYSIAGSNADIFGAEWDPANTSTDMTLAEGLYTWTSGEFTLDAPEAVEFKVVEDHAWTVAYPSENWVLNIPAGGPYTVTITFDADSKEINATYAGESAAEHTYSIAGNNANIFGAEWSETATATEMTFNAEGNLYEWTSAEFSAAEAGEIQFKIVEDHSWTVAYPEGYENNYTVALPAGGPYTLYVAFNAETKEIRHILNGAPVVADTYTVVGGFGDYVEGKTEDAVFGEWWSLDLADNEMTLGIDEVTYTWSSVPFSSEADSKIEFKVVKNHSWDEGAWPTDNYYVAVPAGGPYYLTVTFNPETKEITHVLEGAPIVADTYTVAGGFGDYVEGKTEDAVFGEWWNHALAANDMTLTEGLYTWTSAEFSSEAASKIEFKVVKNHSWDEGAWPTDNYYVAVPAGGPYTLSITFDADSKEINAVLNGAVVTDVYSIAGSDAIFGENEWDATNPATEMALNAESGLYEWTSANFSAEEEYEIQFKVVKNHSWDQGEWPVGYENNYVVTVPAGGPYKLYVAFNLEENTISHELKSGVVAGDVNGDGELDVTDVVAIANYVMGSVPEGFVLEAADLNNDGEVDVTDVVALANKVMGN
ncbi:MAG: hypothetical protein IJ626_02000 [Muribaculaceae bacterium]|nr:hypothetical protein [Muribaculaceae bacterium]